MKKSLIYILVICMLACLCFVVSCNKDSSDSNTNTDANTNTDTNTDDGIVDFVEPKGIKLSLNKDMDFSVTVLDYNSEPIKNAVVKISYLDGTTKMDMTNSEGRVSIPVTAGDIYITADNSETKRSYLVKTKELNEQGAILTAYAELVPQRVHDSGTPDEVSVDDDRIAYVTREIGKYYATGLKEQNVIFFLFIPTQDGIYKFSMDVEGVIGYYGMPMQGREEPLTPPRDDGTCTIEVKKTNIGESADSTTPYLIGIKANSMDVEECVFTIERIGDPTYTAEEIAEWIYVTNPNPPPKTTIGYVNWNVEINDIDITKKIDVVLGDDGYYHLGSKDGELVYVRIGSESAYLASFYEICKPSTMSAIIYDENGNFVRKECYNALINQYYELCDKKTGLIPLDEHIATAIKNHGNKAGWWKPGSVQYRFSSVEGVNLESAWLFACCTISVSESAGLEEENPIKLEVSLNKNIITEYARISSATKLYLKIKSPVDSILTFTGVSEDIVVNYNGTDYSCDENGSITIEIAKNALSFTIENKATEQGELAEFSFTLVEK